MVKERWSQLSPGVRRFILVAGAFEGVLKIAALADLVRRSDDEVRGSKLRWATAIVLINSVGAAPIVYFAFGRRKH